MVVVCGRRFKQARMSSRTATYKWLWSSLWGLHSSYDMFLRLIRWKCTYPRRKPQRDLMSKYYYPVAALILNENLLAAAYGEPWVYLGSPADRCFAAWLAVSSLRLGSQVCSFNVKDDYVFRNAASFCHHIGLEVVPGRICKRGPFVPTPGHSQSSQIAIMGSR